MSGKLLFVHGNGESKHLLAKRHSWQMRPINSELQKKTSNRNKMENALCALKVYSIKKQTNGILKELRVGEVVIQGQLERYRKRIFLPRIYKQQQDPEQKHKTLVPLWYQARTSRSQITVKPASKHMTTGIWSYHLLSEYRREHRQPQPAM